MNILVTGSAGFIGFHLSLKLLKNKKIRVFGIDSLNNYYDKKLKIKRLNKLKSRRNFFFYKINLLEKKKLNLFFKQKNINIVYHIAGQPGVLYSLKNPNSYILNNTKATKVITEIAKKHFVKKFIFASSSSVYGDQKKFPIQKILKKPKNPYAKTKLN